MSENVTIVEEQEEHGEPIENHRMDRVPLLHVYAHKQPHDSVEIIGTKNALRALKDAIDSALKSKDCMACGPNFYTQDGEEYAVLILCNDEPWDSPVWGSTRLPYVDPDYKDSRNAKKMIDLVGYEKYHFYCNLVDQLHQDEVKFMNQVLEDNKAPMPEVDALAFLQTVIKKVSQKLELAGEKAVNDLLDKLKALINKGDE